MFFYARPKSAESLCGRRKAHPSAKEVNRQSACFEKEGGLWKVTGDFQNFCHVCTVNANPSKEGVTAYPEQVFINDRPLTQ